MMIFCTIGLSVPASAQNPCTRWLQNPHDFLIPAGALARPPQFTDQETLFWFGVQNNPAFNPHVLDKVWKTWPQENLLGKRLLLETVAGKLTGWHRNISRACAETTFYKIYGEYFEAYRKHLISLQRQLTRPLDTLLQKDFAKLAASIDLDNLVCVYQQGHTDLKAAVAQFWAQKAPQFSLKYFTEADFYAAAQVRLYNQFIRFMEQHFSKLNFPHQLILAAYSAYGPIYALKIAPPPGQRFIPFTAGETALMEVLGEVAEIFQHVPAEVDFYFDFQENFKELAYYQQQQITADPQMLAQVKDDLLTSRTAKINLPLEIFADPLIGLSQMWHEGNHLKNFVSILHPTAKTTYPLFLTPENGENFLADFPGFYNDGLALDEAFAYERQAKYLASYFQNVADQEGRLADYLASLLDAGKAVQQEALRLLKVIIPALKKQRYDLNLQNYPAWPEHFKVEMKIYGKDDQPFVSLTLPMAKKQFRHLADAEFWQPLTDYLERRRDDLPPGVVENIVTVLLKTVEAQQRRLKKLNFSQESFPQR